MSRKDKIHQLINEAANELLTFIKESEFPDGWVPAAKIKKKLDLNMLTVPKTNDTQTKKGWVFAALVRILEDEFLVEYKLENKRAYYRSL